MSDQDKKQQDSQIEDDSFDFDDIDEISDADLEEMETEFDEAEFDEEDFDSEDWDSFDDEQTAPGAAAGSTKKTFVQKYFNMIVIGVACVIAVLIFLNQLQGDAPAPQTANTAQQFQAPEPEIAARPDPAPASEPAPVPQANIAQNEIFDLDAMPEPSEAQNQEPVAQPPLDTERPENALTPMPDALIDEAEQQLAEVNEIFEEQLNDFELSFEAQQAETTAPQEAIIPAPVSAETTITPTQNPAPDAALSALETQLGNARDEINTLRAQLTAAQQQLTSAQQEKEQALARAQQAEEEREKALQEQAEIQTLITAPPAPVSTPTAAPAAPRAEPVQPVRAQPREQAPSRWVLRSAQPGEALLSPEGSGDLRAVSIGDNVPGLGLIQYIGQQNGLWVVTGTAGRVTQ